jgi:hypothetical protein
MLNSHNFLEIFLLPESFCAGTRMRLSIVTYWDREDFVPKGVFSAWLLAFCHWPSGCRRSRPLAQVAQVAPSLKSLKSPLR